MKISIIIPTYNEASCISNTLSELLIRKSEEAYIKEILVVDGHSQDETQHLVKTFDQAKLIVSKKGRPQQMNVGAKQAKGDILYFLHADSLPPQDYDKLIVDAITNGHKAGCFCMQFDLDHPWMKFISWLTKFSFRACRGGDQSLFVTKELFETCGGYDERFKIFEDHELIGKLYKKTRFYVIQKQLISSARRFREKGILKLQLLFWAIYFKKWMGATPEALFKFYKSYIS